MKLTGRIKTEEDVDFAKSKLDQGMTQAVLVREAIRIYRRYDDIVDQLF